VIVAVSTVTVRAIALGFGRLFLAAEEAFQPAKETAGFFLLARSGRGSRLWPRFASAVFPRLTAWALVERTTVTTLAPFATLAPIAALATVAVAALAGLERGALFAARSGGCRFPTDGGTASGFRWEDVQLCLVVC
jgi:hypothetical protein